MGNQASRKTERADTRYLKPTGLYAHCEWDEKTIRKLILSRKLAPRFPGTDEAEGKEECPICFLNYEAVNRTSCCKKPVCTECYLQVHVPPASRPTTCPFCNHPRLGVVYLGPLSEEERTHIELEEQKVIEAKIKLQKNELEEADRKAKKIEEERLRRERNGQPARAEWVEPDEYYGIAIDTSRPVLRSSHRDASRPSRRERPLTSSTLLHHHFHHFHHHHVLSDRRRLARRRSPPFHPSLPRLRRDSIDSGSDSDEAPVFRRNARAVRANDVPSDRDSEGNREAARSNIHISEYIPEDLRRQAAEEGDADEALENMMLLQAIRQSLAESAQAEDRQAGSTEADGPSGAAASREEDDRAFEERVTRVSAGDFSDVPDDEEEQLRLAIALSMSMVNGGVGEASDGAEAGETVPEAPERALHADLAAHAEAAASLEAPSEPTTTAQNIQQVSGEILFDLEAVVVGEQNARPLDANAEVASRGVPSDRNAPDPSISAANDTHSRAPDTVEEDPGAPGYHNGDISEQQSPPGPMCTEDEENSGYSVGSVDFTVDGAIGTDTGTAFQGSGEPLQSDTASATSCAAADGTRRGATHGASATSAASTSDATAPSIESRGMHAGGESSAPDADTKRATSSAAANGANPNGHGHVALAEGATDSDIDSFLGLTPVD